MHTRTAALAIAALAAAAHADIVEMYYSARGQGQNLQLTAGDRVFNSFAGQLLHQVVSGTGAGEDLVGLNPFYCVDVFEHASGSASEFVISALTEVPDSRPMTPGAAAAMRSIFAQAAEAQYAGDAPAAYAAAFQIAVWEIASDYDDQLGAASLDLADGFFRAASYGGGALPSHVSSYAAGFFDAVDAGAQYDGEVYALRSERFQDQITSRTIPTPGSTAAVTLGLVLTIGRRRH